MHRYAELPVVEQRNWAQMQLIWCQLCPGPGSTVRAQEPGMTPLRPTSGIGTPSWAMMPLRPTATQGSGHFSCQQLPDSSRHKQRDLTIATSSESSLLQIQSDMGGQKKKKQALTLRRACCRRTRARRFLSLPSHVRLYLKYKVHRCEPPVCVEKVAHMVQMGHHPAPESISVQLNCATL